jgi:hypothetical protein
MKSLTIFLLTATDGSTISSMSIAKSRREMWLRKCMKGTLICQLRARREVTEFGIAQPSSNKCLCNLMIQQCVVEQGSLWTLEPRAVMLAKPPVSVPLASPTLPDKCLAFQETVSISSCRSYLSDPIRQTSPCADDIRLAHIQTRIIDLTSEQIIQHHP